jgi:hypothetical protein
MDFVEPLLGDEKNDQSDELAIPAWNDLVNHYESRWREKQYIRAFLELFESGYAPHVGDVERLAGKRARKLSVTLPNNYAD